MRESSWRSRRLLILCWHGISLNDEHHWNPWLYTSADRFRSQLTAIRQNGFTVLPLDEALVRLERGALPPKSIALTFDDGFHDFYTAAAPILNEFGYPATVYLTTFHVDFQKPIFRLLASYLLWKTARNGDNRGPLFHDRAIQVSRKNLRSQLSRTDLSPAQEEDSLGDFAIRVGIDYKEILSRRVLHLMSPMEVCTLASSGNISFELHTHRHRTPKDPIRLSRELTENQSRITELTGRTPFHFSYPNGVVRPDMFPVLVGLRIRSAVTCEPNLVEPGTTPYLIPRLLEIPALDDLTFRSWLDGSLSIFHQLARREPMCYPVLASQTSS